MTRGLFIITGLGTGGAEIMLWRLLTRLHGRELEAHVVCLAGPGAVSARFAAAGIPVEHLGLARGWQLPAIVWKLGRRVRRFRPQIVQGWMYHGNLAAWLAWLLADRRPALCWGIRQSLDDLAHEKPGTRLVIRAGARFSGAPARILYNAAVSRSQHEAIGFSDALGETIPNGFDLDRFQPDIQAGARLRAELGLPPSAILIGLVARFHPVKDHAGFLEAAARALVLCPELRFVLVGAGVDPQNVALAKHIARLGLGDRVYLLGERADIPVLTAGLDIATSSSFAEAFSNALGEAMACGVPCVATGVGDTATLLGDTGRVVPASDPVALASAWVELAGLSPEERCALGRAARARIESNYALEPIARCFAALYAELADRLHE